MTTPLWIVSGVAVVAVVGCVIIYNRLVADRNRVAQSWSDVDVQLQRRHELIPRLVELVKGYAGYEQALLTSLTDLRSRATRAAPAQRGDLEHGVQEGVQRLFALVEAYPDLKATQNFQKLHGDLVDTENQIQYARRYYNGAVNLYNNRIQKFPDLVVARQLRFEPAQFFQLDDDAKAAAPGVNL